MAEEYRDLFGDAVRLPGGRRGRPAHEATQKNRNKVIMLLALGWSDERIANALHVCKPTLRRYYFSELKARGVQRDRLDAWHMEKLFGEAEKGNVGALKELRKFVEKNDLMAASARMAKAEREADDEPVGKKESARRAAEKIADEGGSWGEDLKPGFH